MRAAATEWRGSDAAIVAVSVAGLAIVTALLVLERPPAAAPAATIGAVSDRSGSVRHRPAESLVWDDARLGDRLANGESLFVGPGGSAAVALDDGGRLDLEENSLVVLEARGAAGEPPTVTLRRGAVSATAAGAGVRVRGARGEAALRPGAQARFAGAADDGRLEVALLSGDATVAGASALLTSFPVRLSAPARSERVYFSGAPATVELSWEGAAAGHAIEVARDAGFAATVAAFPGERGAAAWTPPSAGTFYWRAVDAGRAPRSETRSLLLVEDAPPLTFSPADGEVVIAPPGRAVPFWWTAVDGVAAYVVEISASPSFDEVALSVRADRPGAWIDPRLAEGTYHWRVRADAPDRGRSPPSPRSSFRLVHASVPDAPELLDASLQVNDAHR